MKDFPCDDEEETIYDSHWLLEGKPCNDPNCEVKCSPAQCSGQDSSKFFGDLSDLRPGKVVKTLTLKTHPSGGQRYDEAIPAYHLIPHRPLRRLAARYSHGAIKYNPHNWRRGLDAGDCLNRAIEHLYKHIEGDASEDNLAAVVWNIFAVMEYEHSHPELIAYHPPKE